MPRPPFEIAPPGDGTRRDFATFVPIQRSVAPARRVGAAGQRISVPAPRIGAPRVPTETGQWPSGQHRAATSRPIAAPGRRQRGGRRRARPGHPSTFLRTDSRPVIGAHRRPGTLPLESWLLIGRHKQQALLAALVAAGLFLIIIPTQQRTADLAAASAAQRRAAAATNGGSQVPAVKRPARSKTKQRDKDAQAPTAATGTAPTQSAPAEPAAPGEQLPPGNEIPDPGAADVPTGRRGGGPAESVRRTGSATVALTFDDGPDPVQTPKLLALLREHRVKATFCLVGQQAAAHPDLVREIAADGHALCNHSWNHSFTLGRQKSAAIRTDLEKTNAAIRAAVPDADIAYFRAPGGNFTDRLVGITDEFGMTPLYWEVDPRDWEQPTDETDAEHVDRVVNTVQTQVRRGSIVLSHDYNQPNTIAAYEILLPRLAEKFTLGLP
jgi:peptidoglycan/xylan/chitin deacetylase (PgdA/CDA1 family)